MMVKEECGGWNYIIERSLALARIPLFIDYLSRKLLYLILQTPFLQEVPQTTIMRHGSTTVSFNLQGVGVLWYHCNNTLSQTFMTIRTNGLLSYNGLLAP